MAKIITITNQKGGVGKTSTTQTLTAGLKNRGYKVLAVDLDGQATLSKIMGATEGVTVLELMKGDVTAEETIQHTAQGDIIPASMFLYNATDIFAMTGKEYKLKEALAPVINDYDFILIDTPPALSILTVNAIVCADTILITAQADIPTIDGISQLATVTIPPIKKYCNPDITIAGILLIRYNGRATLNRQIASYMKELTENINTKLFKTKIREGIAIREAQTLKRDVFDYAPKSKVAQDYNEFITELLDSLK